MDLPGMDVTQALSLHLVEEGLRAVLPAVLTSSMEQHFRQAEQTLSSLASHNALCRWQDKVRSLPAQRPLLAPTINDDVLHLVQEALLAELQLDVEHLALEATAPTALRIHPLALIQRGLVSYSAATAWDYVDVRLTRSIAWQGPRLCNCLHVVRQTSRSMRGWQRVLRISVPLRPYDYAQSLARHWHAFSKRHHWQTANRSAPHAHHIHNQN